ncbi:MAG: GHKL domain-containing protein, partial [Anaerovoracaceae bacterium]
KDGLPVSDRPFHGLGVKSISSIATRHNGMFSFDAADGVFTMRVILNL